MARRKKVSAVQAPAMPDEMAGIESDMEYHAGRLAELHMKRSPSYRRMKASLTKKIKAAPKFGPNTKF